MEHSPLRRGVIRALKVLGRLALATSLFVLIAPSPAASAPQPQVCRSAISISV